MIEVTASVDVDRSAQDAFGVLADFERNTEWQKGMQSCRWTSDPPLRLGSTYDQEASFLGRKILTSFEVVELEAGRTVKIASRESTFPIAVTRSVEPLGEGRCRVSALVEGDSSGLFKLAEPLMRRMVERSVRADYARLKDLLESESPAGGSDG